MSTDHGLDEAAGRQGFAHELFIQVYGRSPKISPGLLDSLVRWLDTGRRPGATIITMEQARADALAAAGREPR